MRPHPNLIFEFYSDDLEEKVSKIKTPTKEQASSVEEARILIRRKEHAEKIQSIIDNL